MSEAHKRIVEYKSGTLDLSNLELYELPYLPDNIKILNISNNFIEEIKLLPKNLKGLIANQNKITSISFNENNKLIYLNLSGNKLKSFDDSFKYSSMLKHLNISNNNFESIPEIKDINLFELLVMDNNISIIDFLPSNLKIFNCSGNKINKICQLPPSVNFFDCSRNEIQELSDFMEDCELERFFCNDNRLKKLPDIPYSINNLDCSDNLLTELPSLIKLDYLNYKNNPLIGTPTVPSKFTIKKIVSKGEMDIRNPFHLELFENCYDYINNHEVAISDFMLDIGNILIKIYDDYYGINRRKLLEDASNIDNILFLKDGNERYIKTIMMKIVSSVDFIKFADESYSIYILSRTQHLQEFGSNVSEGIFLGEPMIVHPFSLESYIERIF